MALLDATFWQGVGAGGISAAVASATTFLTRRHGRLSRLEDEVAACKRRDARMLVVEAGFRLVVGALARREPNSPELRMCRDLLNKHLPLSQLDCNLTAFGDLLNSLDIQPGSAAAAKD